MTDAGFPAFRARQIYEWIYRRAATSFDEMTNLARDFRAWLTAHCELETLTVLHWNPSDDGSFKAVFQLRDGKLVESVLIREREWYTLCVSSQVGCAVDCKFCMTGRGGFKRHMTVSEIVGQLLAVRRQVPAEKWPRNLVFMGMGEPLLNLDNVIPAVRLMTDADGIAMAGRRITVSTSGILPGLQRLAEENLDLQLAVSLNGPNDEKRSRIMPINRIYPLEDLMEACRTFPLRQKRRVTFEYVMLKDENDGLADARQLARLLRRFPCKINLIPWNPDASLPFSRPDTARVREFQQYLLDHNYTVSVRWSKGLDVSGACGQLAAHAKNRGVEARS